MKFLKDLTCRLGEPDHRFIYRERHASGPAEGDPDLPMDEDEKRLAYGYRVLLANDALARAEQLTLTESDDEKREHLEETFKDLRRDLSEDIEGGLTAAELDVLQRNIESALMGGAETRPAERVALPETRTETGYIELSGKEVETWIENIAAEYSTTVEAIMAVPENAGKVKKVTSGMAANSKYFKSHHVGRHYVLAETTLMIPVTKTVTVETGRVGATDMGATGIEGDVDKAPVEIEDEYQHFIERQAERDAQVADNKAVALDTAEKGYESTVLLDYRGRLQGRVVEMPEFLQRKSPDEFAKLFEAADQERNSTVQRTYEILKDPFFNEWGPVKFRRIMWQHGPSLRFGDLSRNAPAFREGPRVFFNRYEEVAAQVDEWDVDIQGRQSQFEDEFSAALENGQNEDESDEAWTARHDRLETYPRKNNESLEAWEARIRAEEPENQNEWSREGRAVLQLIVEISELEHENDLPTLRREKARRERFMVRCAELMDAMEAMTEGTPLEQLSPFERIIERSGVEEGRFIPGGYYDFNAITSGKVVEYLGEEDMETISIEQQVIDDVKVVLAAMGVRPAQLKKVDGGTVLNLVINAYGMDLLVQEGHIKKSPSENALFLASLPSSFTRDNRDLQHVVDTMRARPADLVFQQEELHTMRVREMQEVSPELHSFARVQSAFEGLNRRAHITYAQAESVGGKSLFLHTNLLERKMDPTAAARRIVDSHTTYTEDGEVLVHHEAMQQALERYIEQGILFYYLDPTIDIVAELESVLGVENVSRDDVRKIRAFERKIEPVLKKIERKTRQAEERRAWARKAKLKHLQIQYEEKAVALDDELYDPVVGLYAQLDEYQTEIRDTLAPHIPKLIEKLDIHLDEGEMDTPFTDLQRHFIQNGYVVSEGMRSTIDDGQRKLEVVKRYNDNPIVSAALEQIIASDIEGELSSADLEVAAGQVQLAAAQMKLIPLEHAEGEPMTEQQLDILYAQLTEDYPEDERPPRDVILGFLSDSATSSVQGEEGITTERVVVGGFVAVPIRNDAGQTVVTISVGARGGFDRDLGMPVASAGAGVSTPRLSPFASEVLGVTISAHAGGGTEGFVATASATASLKIEDFALAVGASVGPAFNPLEGEFVPFVGVHAGVRWAPSTREQIARGRRRGEIEGSAYFEGRLEGISSVDEKAAVIRELPEFESIAAYVDGLDLPEASRDEALVAAYEFAQEMYAKEQGGYREATTDIVPIPGFALSIIPPFGLLTLAFRDETRVIPLRPSYNDAFTDSMNEVEQALANTELSGAKLYERILEGGTALPEAEYGYIDGNLSYMPTSEVESNVDFGLLRSGNIDDLNSHLLSNGLEIHPGEGDAEGLHRIEVKNPGGRVIVCMDPTMKGRQVLGPDARPDQIYLALDMTNTNLKVLRQEIEVPRAEYEGGPYKITVITIRRSSDPRRNFNTFQRERRLDPEYAAGWMVFEEYSRNVRIHGGYNALTWEEYLREKESLTQKGLVFSEEHLRAENAHVEAHTERVTAARIDDLGSHEELIEARARDFLKTLPEGYTEKKILEALTGTRQLDELDAVIADRYPGMKALDRGLFINVLFKLSYVDNTSLSPQEKANYVERHKAFFERILTEEYGPALAGWFFNNVKIDTIYEDRTRIVPRTSRVQVVVGRLAITGMREQVAGGGELVNAKQVDDPAVIQSVLEGPQSMEAEPGLAGFLHSPEALEIKMNYKRVKGERAYATLQKVYEEIHRNHGYVPTSGSTEATVLEEFQSFVERLQHAAQATDPKEKVVLETTEDGQLRAYTMQVEVYAGLRGRCLNPGFELNSTLLSIDLSQYESARGVSSIEGFYNLFTPTLELFAGGMHQHETIVPQEVPGEPSVEGEGNELPGRKPGDTQETGEGPQGGRAEDTGDQDLNDL